MQKPMVRSRRSDNVREQHLISRPGVKENSHIKYTNKGGREPREAEDRFKFCCGSQIHLGLILGKR